MAIEFKEGRAAQSEVIRVWLMYKRRSKRAFRTNEQLVRQELHEFSKLLRRSDLQGFMHKLLKFNICKFNSRENEELSLA